ncbi:MAG: sigma-54-dependent Fis family transcriptional regulator [Acidobacteria bacterium]|nr:sigma-54-dependent Fis family transcriptional regulator [Acidobacteriota bacterium]
MERLRILILNLCPDGGLCEPLRAMLEAARAEDGSGFAVETRSPADSDAPPESCADARLTFLVLPNVPNARAARLLKTLAAREPAVPVVVVAEEAGPAATFELLRGGADDFVVPPLKASDVLPRAWRLLEGAKPDESLKRRLKERLGLRNLIGESAAFTAEVGKIPAIARSDVRILISGETGTGKELCARAIHYLSPRTAGPFIPVNCGAIPPELVENELFGHERGAYTGAATSQAGLIREAEGGTLFLDEVDCLPLLAQVKLLRFLQEREYRPLGSARMRRADVRVITAANVDMAEAVSEGRVRKDFYYRLNIIPLRLPPLRERRADIALLARHFLEKFAAEFARGATRFSDEALAKLRAYAWPGNVRELEHVVERAVALSAGEVISEAEIDVPVAAAAAAAGAGGGSFKEAKARAVEEFERQYLSELLDSHGGNITRAAQAAKKNRRAFWQLLRKHHINVRGPK